MLNYPFPYDSEAVQRAVRRVAGELSLALDAAGAPKTRLGAVKDAWRALSAEINAGDNRYLEFQLWQEGVGRYIEYECARLAASVGHPPEAFRSLPDYEPYAAVAKRGSNALRRELRSLDLGKQRRISFYTLGAALAMLLDPSDPGWKRRYQAAPFEMTPLLGVRP
jgi:hypothetical protein